MRIPIGYLYLGLIALFILTLYLYTRFCIPPPRSRPLRSVVDGSHSIATKLGSFSKLLYSQVKGAGSSCCSICLLEYKERDVLRLLLDCGHYFHSKCIDQWLRTNPSCPNCRTSPVSIPVPTPVATPLSEVPMLMAPRQ
ncbi:RING-H2 finger protein ATL70-like [Eucalyptus grandis]|uniref:RING-H2 finger protein ATL70-like n=1 Tax=Eucalyptus grandis TaxID=71139 RepID=UPI000527374C|nr:RING-H2 finger protein ATL70-like [Eucalyptus grandis]